jgi:hypothetical protein
MLTLDLVVDAAKPKIFLYKVWGETSRQQDKSHSQTCLDAFFPKLVLSNVGAKERQNDMKLYIHSDD